MDKKAITILDNASYLRQKSSIVNLNDFNLENDINDLEDFCIKNEVMAMAAIQIGIPKRIIYIKNTNLEIINKFQQNNNDENDSSYNEARVLINPIIISKEGLTDYWEACASCVDFLGHVYRPYKILVEYYDLNGKKHLENFEGFESTVLSHEMDHLDGILHIDIADDLFLMDKQSRKKFRLTHGYNIFSKTGNYDDLLEKTSKKLMKKF